MLQFYLMNICGMINVVHSLSHMRSNEPTLMYLVSILKASHYLKLVAQMLLIDYLKFP